MDTYHEILEYIYIGSSDTLENNTKFQFIVNCSVNVSFPNNISDIKRMRIPVEDDPRDAIKFVEMIVYTKVLEKILDCILKKENVFIYSGQRAYILVACFLLKYYHIAPKEAMEYISKKRDIPFVEKECFHNTLNIFYQYLKYRKDTQKIDEI
jgi:hypothetical protein